MRFSISRRKENDLPLLILENLETRLKAAILPSFGALLHSFSIPVDGNDFNIIDNYSSLDELNKTLDTSYKSSKLSPFVCRIEKGRYRYGSKDYEFQKKFPDGSAIHGLLYNKFFEVIEEKATENCASVTMQYHYKRDDPGYPFEYTCLVKYQLKELGILQVETAVLNTSKERIPISDGWHPYFQLGGRSDEWTLSFHSSHMVEFNEQLIPTGKLIPNQRFTHPEPIWDTFLDNCFQLDKVNGTASCTLQNKANGLQLKFLPSSHYPFLQIYTPPHRRSIAIENLSSAPDSFNNGMGLILLEPDHSHAFSLAYQLEVKA